MTSEKRLLAKRRNLLTQLSQKRPRDRWCPACNKMSGHPAARCPNRPLTVKFVEIPKK
jgi:hypothetical protein